MQFSAGGMGARGGLEVHDKQYYRREGPPLSPTVKKNAPS